MRSSVPLPALFFRSLPLFLILWQLCLIAGDLADTPVYAASLVIAFLAGFLFASRGHGARGERRSMKPGEALLAIALIPWAARIFLALPRLFAGDRLAAMIAWDSLLLNLDRNYFVSLLPFYWAAASTYFSARSRRFLRFDIAVSWVMLFVIFLLTRSGDLEAWRWPALLIAVLEAAFLMQLAALVLSLPAAVRLRRGEIAGGCAALFLLALAGGLLVIQPSQERAVSRGGGLLQPNLFQFDFSQILRLESEITMNDDLAFILRAEHGDAGAYTRRFVLSGYNQKQGFYRLPEIDDPVHPPRVPSRRTALDVPARENARIVEQEYYFVNFDASAFIGMNQPAEIIPFESWDASSFTSAYAVNSIASVAGPFELMDAAPRLDRPARTDTDGPLFSAASLGMTEETFTHYTAHAAPPRIAALARSLVQEETSYWRMAQNIYNYLCYGEYRYSLKPGAAADGDQLSHFLFTSKKGYCSYFAFAFALMLRSTGIPCRVAVGFYIDAEQNTFGYYPIRSDMAHAWVEVYYPRYGWIDYDPTTAEPAAGEEFVFSRGVDQDLFGRLMREILENRVRLREKEGEDAAGTRPARISREAVRFMRRASLPLLLVITVMAFLFLRAGPLLAFYAGKTGRKKTAALWKQARRRLALAGEGPGQNEAPFEWTGRLDRELGMGLYALYQEAARARYAREYGGAETARERYRAFDAAFRSRISLPRRILAWLCPPLALVLPPSRKNRDKNNAGAGGEARGKKRASITGGALAVIFLLLAPFPAHAEEPPPAESLLAGAFEAEQNERWERAIELLSRGAEQYPDDFRFPWELGSLYYSRRLYALAWEAYRKAEPFLPPDADICIRLSRTAGYLNMNTVSASYLEKALGIDPLNREAIDSLGFMYYKLHRLNDGERLLLAAVEALGPERNFCMTLGTIYSGMFRYDDSKAWYLKAIAEAERVNARSFASVAHYNLSILESRYYYYANAFEHTNASLASEANSSGRLARGELYLRQLDFPKAFADYQNAWENDTSPLSKMNLALAFRLAGRLEESRRYAEECLASTEHSWMLNYGIDPARYRRDLYEILYEAYRGLYHAERFRVHAGFLSSLRGFFRRWRYRFRAASRRFLFKKYSLLAARAYGAGEESSNSVFYGEAGLDAQTEYYHAFSSYPLRARNYLENARRFETPIIPRSRAAYDAEEGVLTQKAALLRRAAGAYDPVWEKDMIAESLVELCRLLRGTKHRAEREDAAERLYALNRGGLRQYGLRLPVEIAVAEGTRPASPRAVRRVKQTLTRMGFEEARPASGFPGGAAPESGGARFSLVITLTGNEALCELYDRGRGRPVFREIIPLPSLSRKDLAAFAGVLENTAFTGF
ncbi:MAG: hypothetical protein LBC88_03285 [Spirochaetaceae bacterium]|jgi:transglutaminase-like putative cysteine protease/tetratricopeptide (TPR) repeat protein|nr:hypothetical protein [Spirochaetaceae bacterium]